jgi:hypothetical protein
MALRWAKTSAFKMIVILDVLLEIIKKQHIGGTKEEQEVMRSTTLPRLTKV